MPDARRWRATYDDGAGGTPRPTEVWFGGDGLVIDGIGVWPYRLIRLDSGVAPLRLEVRESPPRSVTVADPAFRGEIARFFPALLEHSGGTRRLLAPVGVLLIGACALAALAWFWLLPELVTAGASLVPRALEEQLGAAVMEAAAPPSRRCARAETVGPVEELVRVLEQGTPSPYRYRVAVVDDPTVNAFAAPGGFLVVHTGLVEKTTSPADLAGVLAHEMQHVILRHGTRALLRGFGIRLLVAWMLGDAGAVAALGARLGELAYLREDEAAADREGMAMLRRARLDPYGLVRLMAILEREAPGAPGAVRYLSTHPGAGERAEALRALAAAAPYTPRVVLPGVAWPPRTAECGSRGAAVGGDAAGGGGRR